MKRGALAATLCSGLASSAEADTINVADGGRFETVTWTFNGVSETGLAGAISTTINGGKAFDAYCMDLYDDTYLNTAYTGSETSLSKFNATTAGHPLGGNPNLIGALYDTYAASATTGIKSAALQIAIWAVDYDGNFSGSLPFNMSDSTTNTIQHQVYQQAEADVLSLTANSNGSATWIVPATHGPNNNLTQDLVGPSSANPNVSLPPNPVPEPSTVIMTALGVAGVAATTARRRLAAR